MTSAVSNRIYINFYDDGSSDSNSISGRSGSGSGGGRIVCQLMAPDAGYAHYIQRYF